MKLQQEGNYKHSNYGWYSITKKEYGEDGFWSSGFYSTKHGIVSITYGYHPNRREPEKYTLSYDFVWKGRINYVSYKPLHELTDQQIKIYATKFVKSIVG